MLTRPWNILVLACSWVCLLGIAQAAVPKTIHYQGKLTESDGTPVVGEHTVTMRLYDAFTAGTKRWEEQHRLNFLREDQGVLSLDLGSRTPFEGLVSFNDPVFLSIEIDTGGELVPRQALTSVGYALNADRLDGASVGTSPGSIVQLDATGALPAVSGANLTKLKTIIAADTSEIFLTAGSGVTVTKGVASWQIAATGSSGGIGTVNAGTGLTGGGSSAAVTLNVGAGTGIVVGPDAVNVDVGTGPNQIVQLDAAGKIPDATLSSSISLLGSSIESAEVTDGTLTAADTAGTFLTAGSGVALTKGAASWEISATGTGGDITGVVAGAGLSGGAGSGEATLDVGAGTGIVVAADAVSVDVGTTAGKIVQLDASGALPAVSGTNLTNLNASNLTSGTVPDARLSANVSLFGALVDASELAPNSVGAAALAPDAIQPGDIEVGDLPAHASTHQPGGSDALPTASAVSIGSTNSAGSSSSLARADHTHQGLHSLAASGQPQIVGDVVLAPGSNITLSQAGQTVTVASTAPAAGNRVTASASGALTIDTAADTTLLSATITKSQAGSALLILATVQLTQTANPNSKTVDLKLFRGATQLDANYTARLGTAAGTVQNLPVELHFVDTSGTGTFTFTLRARSSGAGAQATVRRLTVMEVL